VDFATGEKYQLETDYTGAGDNPLVLRRNRPASLRK